MSDPFQPADAEALAPFVTNLDRPVFALRHLPEVVKGAAFSRYSRTTKSLRRVLLDEFLAGAELGLVPGSGAGDAEKPVDTARAEAFYERVLVGYGDDSVAELGYAHLAVEEISNLATKVIEDARIGISPLEKSTRYVAFDRMDEGRYMYVRPRELAEAGLLAGFESTCDRLFATYSDLLPRVSAWAADRFPQEEGEPDIAYRSTIRAKSCDLLRGLLPAATRTNLGLAGNGRAFEYLLSRMYAEDLDEVRSLSAQMHRELREVIPAFVRRADGERGERLQAMLRQGREAGRGAAAALGGVEGGGAEATGPGVRLVRSDPDGVERVLAAIAFPHTTESMETLKARVRGLDSGTRAAILEAYGAGRQNRHHRPGRAYEEASLTVEVVANFGAYRDLQRHRLVSQQRQLLGCELGYDLPEELTEAGLAEPYRQALEQAGEAWSELALSVGPAVAQYVVPLAFRMRWYMTLNAREAFHLCELRSQEQGHPDYRRVAIEIADRLGEAYPELAAGMTFLNRSQGANLERREAERRLAHRRAALEAQSPG